MGVYIQGMEMPKCCFDCPCYHQKVDAGYYDFEIFGASGTVFNDGYSSVTGHKDHIDPFKQRLDNCPLVPVPPHGRLVDMDTIEERIDACCNDIDCSETMCNKCAVQIVMNKVFDAPTVIPAEPGETQREYEAAVEQVQYCEQCEPTYDPDTGAL